MNSPEGRRFSLEEAPTLQNLYFSELRAADVMCVGDEASPRMFSLGAPKLPRRNLRLAVLLRRGPEVRRHNENQTKLRQRCESEELPCF